MASGGSEDGLPNPLPPELGIHIEAYASVTQYPTMKWRLPPSKSHLIRAMALYSQSNQAVKLFNATQSGEDARAMRSCLEQLGVSFSDFSQDGTRLSSNHPQSSYWLMQGVGINGFRLPKEPLNAMNSGTTLRILACLAARLSGQIVLDGDASLRRRDSSFLWDSLRLAGVRVSSPEGDEHLPVTVEGPWSPEKLVEGVELDVSGSSQALSSWMLASAALPHPVELKLLGEGVSNRHAELTRNMVESLGGRISYQDEVCRLEPFTLSSVSDYTVPGDASMAAFAMLASRCMNFGVELINWPNERDSIGHEVLKSNSIEVGIQWSEGHLHPHADGHYFHIDLKDANDLLPPMAALMALASGGRISGASHAALKESNRLQRTVDVLACFGVKATVHDDGIEVVSGQELRRPLAPVAVYGDHRLFMTAVLLASKTGGVIAGPALHTVADEGFLSRLIQAGIQIMDRD